jgi:hypothetical protein
MARKLRDPALERAWRERVARWAASGLSVRAFCRQQGLNRSRPATLRHPAGPPLPNTRCTFAPPSATLSHRRQQLVRECKDATSFIRISTYDYVKVKSHLGGVASATLPTPDKKINLSSQSTVTWKCSRKC